MEAVKVESDERIEREDDIREIDDEWKTVMQSVINDTMDKGVQEGHDNFRAYRDRTVRRYASTTTKLTTDDKDQETPKNESNNNSPKTKMRKRNWSEVMKYTSTKRDVCKSFPAKKSVRPVEDSSKKIVTLMGVTKLSPRKPLSNGCSRIGGLSDMDLNDRLHLRKVQIEKKSKAEQSRVILENLQSGRSSTVETVIDRTLPLVKRMSTKHQDKKIVLKLVEI